MFKLVTGYLTQTGAVSGFSFPKLKTICRKTKKKSFSLSEGLNNWHQAKNCGSDSKFFIWVNICPSIHPSMYVMGQQSEQKTFKNTFLKSYFYPFEKCHLWSVWPVNIDGFSPTKSLLSFSSKIPTACY